LVVSGRGDCRTPSVYPTERKEEIGKGSVGENWEERGGGKSAKKGKTRMFLKAKEKTLDILKNRATGGEKGTRKE